MGALKALRNYEVYQRHFFLSAMSGAKNFREIAMIAKNSMRKIHKYSEFYRGLSKIPIRWNFLPLPKYGKGLYLSKVVFGEGR